MINVVRLVDEVESITRLAAEEPNDSLVVITAKLQLALRNGSLHEPSLSSLDGDDEFAGIGRRDSSPENGKADDDGQQFKSR